MINLARIIEKAIIYVLIIMMAGILILATIELGYHLFKAIAGSNYLLLDLDELMDLFGAFLLVLIGIELLDTIKVYLRESIVHVEVVVLVAIIAIARKVVVLKIEELPGETIIGIGLLIVSLAVSYYLIKKSGLLVWKTGEVVEEGKEETLIKLKKKKGAGKDGLKL
jgi:uncharacterized membrane protein (DUF373 family)